jgi:hypothetical protein
MSTGRLWNFLSRVILVQKNKTTARFRFSLAAMKAALWHPIVLRNNGMCKNGVVENMVII